MDTSARHMAMNELKKEPPVPFQGEPRFFQYWLASLQHRIRVLLLPAMDVLDILEAHTAGAPRALVRTTRVSHGSNPERALQQILQQLKERFGAPEEISRELFGLIHAFKKITGSDFDKSVAHELRELSDLCSVILAHLPEVPDLQTLNFACGIQDIREKLPEFMNHKFAKYKAKHMSRHQGRHPTFEQFCKFLSEKVQLLHTDNASRPDVTRVIHPTSNPVDIHARTFYTKIPEQTQNSYRCPIHECDTHNLTSCLAFGRLDIKVRKLIVRCCLLCPRCLTSHPSSACTLSVACEFCGAPSHHTLMHHPVSERAVNQRPPHTNSEAPTRVKRTQYRSQSTYNQPKSGASLNFKHTPHFTSPPTRSPCTTACRHQQPPSPGPNNRWPDLKGPPGLTRGAPTVLHTELSHEHLWPRASMSRHMDGVPNYTQQNRQPLVNSSNVVP